MNVTGFYSEEKLEESRRLAQRILPPGAEVLFLSLTGSRAFGWADDRYDYDIHGVFRHPGGSCEGGGYWDHVHAGLSGIDLNLWELDHAFMDIRMQHFSFFQNMSNPFYVRGGFDHKGMMGLCTLRAVKGKASDVKIQIYRFKESGDPRSALHSYRILLVPINFIERGEMELDVMKLSERYGVGMPPKLRECYIHGGNVGDLLPTTYRELDRLHERFTSLIEGVDAELDNKKLEEWRKNVV